MNTMVTPIVNGTCISMAVSVLCVFLHYVWLEKWELLRKGIHFLHASNHISGDNTGALDIE